MAPVDVQMYVSTLILKQWIKKRKGEEKNNGLCKESETERNIAGLNSVECDFQFSCL